MEDLRVKPPVCACASRLNIRLRVARGHPEAKRSDGYIYIYIPINKYDGGTVVATRWARYRSPNKILKY